MSNDPGTIRAILVFAVPISLTDWEDFCSRYGIARNFDAIGGNVYSAGMVQIAFGEGWRQLTDPPEMGSQVVFSAPAGKRDDVYVHRAAELAWYAWMTFDGTLSADMEIRRLIRPVQR